MSSSAATQEADSLARSDVAGADVAESNAENTAPGAPLVLNLGSLTGQLQ